MYSTRHHIHYSVTYSSPRMTAITDTLACWGGPTILWTLLLCQVVACWSEPKSQDSEAYLGILCQLLAQFHKFTNCQCHPKAFTFQPYDSIQASRNKSQIVQTIVYKFLPCILVSLSTYIDARLYFLSKFSSHYSDLHTSILSLASTWNINLRTRVKENPMRFQCKSITVSNTWFSSNTWFHPGDKIL